MSNIDIFIWEFLGTTILCLLGNGSVAAVVLKNSYSHGTGGDWIIIVLGWGFGVFAGASVAAPPSGAHINPAVSLALAISGGIPWSSLPVYWAAQMLGGIVGASLCWVAFKLQFDNMDDNSGTRGIFCTTPFVKGLPWNVATEVIATFVLVFFILTNPQANGGALSYGAVTFVVITIGFGLGGPTATPSTQLAIWDRGSRTGSCPSRARPAPDWSYSWVPVFGPLLGTALAAGLGLLVM